MAFLSSRDRRSENFQSPAPAADATRRPARARTAGARRLRTMGSIPPIRTPEDQVDRFAHSAQAAGFISRDRLAAVLLPGDPREGERQGAADGRPHAEVLEQTVSFLRI